jgi:hypothetical protein
MSNTEARQLQAIEVLRWYQSHNRRQQPKLKPSCQATRIEMTCRIKVTEQDDCDNVTVELSHHIPGKDLERNHSHRGFTPTKDPKAESNGPQQSRLPCPATIWNTSTMIGKEQGNTRTTMATNKLTKHQAHTREAPQCVQCSMRSVLLGG